MDTRASSRLEDADGAPDDVVDQLSVPATGPSNSSATAPNERSRLADEEAALVSRLADLQRTERMALLRRKVVEWEAREAAGFPEGQAEPPRVVGEAPAPSIEPTASTSSASNRRPRVDDNSDDESADEAPPSHKRRQYDINLHIPDPARYAGRSYREYTAYIRSCEQRFEARPYEFGTDKARALYVKAWSEGEAQDSLYRRLEGADTTPTWEELKMFLRGLVSPVAQRLQDAARAYHGAKQRKDQTINSFITYVEGLEETMPAISDINRVTHLKQALRDEIVLEILAGSDQPITRKQLIEAAQRAEQVHRLRGRAQRDDRIPYRGAQPATGQQSPRFVPTTPRPPVREPARRSWVAPESKGRDNQNRSQVNRMPVNNRLQQGNDSAPTTRDKSKDSCRHCGKLGHWEKDCWQKNGGRPGQAKA